LSRCSSARAARRKACRRAAISTASKSRSRMDWRPKSASISWTMSPWISVWSPFFGPPRRRPLAEVPSRRQPTARRPPNRCRPVGETRVRPRFAVGPQRPARPSKTASAFCPPRPESGCSRTVAGLGISAASATRFATLDRSFGNRATTHGAGLSQFGDELADTRWDFKRGGHATILRHYKP